MDNLCGESYDWSTFPVWRKVLIGCFMVLFFIAGYQLFSEESDIYTTAPDIPGMETKQVVPIHVNHSNLRYVTEKEAEKLSYLRTTVPTVVLTLLLGSVGLLLTHRDANRKRKGKNSRELEAFSRCPRTPGQTPTATELASPHTAGPQTPPITAEFLPVSFPSVLPPSVLRSLLHVSTDCTPRTGALVERLQSNNRSALEG